MRYKPVGATSHVFAADDRLHQRGRVWCCLLQQAVDAAVQYGFFEAVLFLERVGTHNNMFGKPDGTSFVGRFSAALYPTPNLAPFCLSLVRTPFPYAGSRFCAESFSHIDANERVWSLSQGSKSLISAKQSECSTFSTMIEKHVCGLGSVFAPVPELW